MIRAEGNVLISASDATEVDISAGTTSTADDMDEGASVGAALAVPIIDKVTEAFVAGADVVRGLAAASVTAEGNAPAIDVHDGSFTIGSEDDSGEPGEIGALGLDLDSILNVVFDFVLIDLTAVDPVQDDPSLTKQRTATPETTADFGARRHRDLPGRYRDLQRRLQRRSGRGAAAFRRGERDAQPDERVHRGRSDGQRGPRRRRTAISRCWSRLGPIRTTWASPDPARRASLRPGARRI